MPSTILSDNGVTSGTSGLKSTGSNDGQLALQTTTAGGTATTALTIDTSQNVGIGTNSPTGAGKILHLNNSGTDAADVVDLRFTTGTTGATSNDGVRIRLANVGDLDINNLEAKAVLISTQNTERMRVPSAGGVQCVTTLSVGNVTPSSSGAGITFPATQSASSDANTLDDYEEGTWTPVDVSGASLTLTITGTARYVKIGNLVFYSVDIVTYPSTASGVAAKIGGLPFTCNANNTGTINPVSINVYADAGLVVANTTQIFLYAAGTTTQSTNANLSGAAIYGISGCYQV